MTRYVVKTRRRNDGRRKSRLIDMHTGQPAKNAAGDPVDGGGRVGRAELVLKAMELNGESDG